jgi:hypothetical protein
MRVTVAGLRLVARGRQLARNLQAHALSLAFMVQRPDQFDAGEGILAKHHVADAARASSGL